MSFYTLKDFFFFSLDSFVQPSKRLCPSSITHHHPLPSATINILGPPLTQSLIWKLHISLLAQSTSSRSCVLYRLCQFFFPSQMPTLYGDLVRPWMAYILVVGEASTHTALVGAGFRFSPRTECCYFKNSAAVMLPFLSSIEFSFKHFL